MKKIIALLLIVIITQPISFAFGRKSTMNDVMNNWVGENINTVIQKWGYPTKQQTVAGKEVYYWEETFNTIGGGDTIYGTTIQTPVYSMTYTCNRILEVDKNYMVVRWDWNGNYCPINHLSGKRYINPNNNPWKK